MTLHLEQLAVPSMEKPSGDLPEPQRPQDAPALSILPLKPPGLRTQQIGNLLLGLFKDLVTAELQMLQVGRPAPLQAFPQDPCRSHQSCSKGPRTGDQQYMRTEEKHFVSHFARSLLGDPDPGSVLRLDRGSPSTRSISKSSQSKGSMQPLPMEWITTVQIVLVGRYEAVQNSVGSSVVSDCFW